MTTEFAAYLRAAMSKFATQKEFAQAIGVDATHVSRALKGTGTYTFNVENCLRLANVADRPPTEVLRAAGKTEIADLLDALCPRSVRPLPYEQREVLRLWATVPDADKPTVRHVMERFVVARESEVATTRQPFPKRGRRPAR